MSFTLGKRSWLAGICIIPLLAQVFLLSSCSERIAEANPEIVPDFVAKLGTNIVLSYGQAVKIENTDISFRFSDVRFDARCPLGGDIVCFWEGMARIDVEIQSGTRREQFEMTITGAPRAEVIRWWAVYAFGYRFELINLDPYPDTRVPRPDISQYTATFCVNPTGADYPGDPVIIADTAPGWIVLDDYQLVDASIADNSLMCRFRYSGGCRPHYIFAYMSPSYFLESNPVQANIYFRHDANQDMCEALLTEEFRFDLEPVVELHRQQYGDDGPIILNLFEAKGGNIVKKLSVILN